MGRIIPLVGAAMALLFASSATSLRAAAAPAPADAPPPNLDPTSRPVDWVKVAQHRMAAKDYREAAKDFAIALKLDPRNADAWVGYGDALRATAADADNLRAAAGAWQEAARVDPRHKTALRRLLEYYRDVAQFNPSPDVLDAMRDTAIALAAADPTPAAADDDVRAIAPMATVRKWLGGHAVEPDARDAALAELAKWQRGGAADPDVSMFTALAKLKLAEAARTAGRADDATRLCDEAHAAMDAAVAAHPTGGMYFAAAQVYQAREQMEAGNDVARSAMRAKKRDMYRKAAEVAREDDPLYVVIQINAARALSSASDQAGAEKILRDLYARRPDDQQVRLALVEQLASDRAKRGEAIAILSQPFSTAGLGGTKLFLARELRVNTALHATNLKLDAFKDAAGPAERAKLRADAQESLASLMLLIGEDGRYLRLLGKLQRIDGRTVEAVQTLEKARAWYDQRTPPGSDGGFDRWEVIDSLARAYIEANQLGQAKILLADMVARFPTYAPARMMLTQILIKDGSHDAARPHVEFLKRRDPRNPEVLKMEFQLMQSVAEADTTDQRRQTYAALPEASKAEMLEKVTAAMVINDRADAERLVKRLQQEHPGDYDTARMAARVYRAFGEPDKAREAVTAALKVNPSDPQLQVLSQQVADLPPRPSSGPAVRQEPPPPRVAPPPPAPPVVPPPAQ